MTMPLRDVADVLYHIRCARESAGKRLLGVIVVSLDAGEAGCAIALRNAGIDPGRTAAEADALKWRLNTVDPAGLPAPRAVDLPGPCPPRPMRDAAEQEACFKLPDGVEPCPAIWGDVSQQVWCTRGTEHEGDHVVGGKDGMVRARWPQETST